MMSFTIRELSGSRTKGVYRGKCSLEMLLLPVKGHKNKHYVDKNILRDTYRPQWGDNCTIVIDGLDEAIAEHIAKGNTLIIEDAKPFRGVVYPRLVEVATRNFAVLRDGKTDTYYRPKRK